jgi:EAL domain-containing protein (putative c-di-GMP-specific phosphodiesterase class I)
MRQAIAEGGFEVHYQPVVDLATTDQRLRGAAALAASAARHDLAGRFIPVAEDTGLINELGEFVLQTRCAEAATWPEHVRIAVNVSPVQFRSQTLALNVATRSRVRTCAVAAGARDHRGRADADDEAALATLHTSCARSGVRIALDDFGHRLFLAELLHRFPFDKIKIDRSFVKNIGDEGASSAIIRRGEHRDRQQHDDDGRRASSRNGSASCCASSAARRCRVSCSAGGFRRRNRAADTGRARQGGSAA